MQLDLDADVGPSRPGAASTPFSIYKHCEYPDKCEHMNQRYTGMSKLTIIYKGTRVRTHALFTSISTDIYFGEEVALLMLDPSIHYLHIDPSALDY